MSRRRKLAGEDGLSLVELLVAMSIGMVVMVGVLTIVQATARSSNRTTARVVANQAARPALTKIIDELHSSCISPDLAPIQAGSGNSTITFIYSSDVGVNPTPQKKTISLNSSGVLNEATYAYNSGAAPDWTFKPTPANFQLASNVTPATVGGQSNVALFRYYAYDGTGTISTSPLSTPLGAGDAASVVKVTVSLAITPPKTTPAPDLAATLSVSDSALLRFSPGTTSSTDNLPCA